MKIKRNVLVETREKSGLSQMDLAKKSGVAQGTISAIESGQTPHPRIDVLSKLCKVLKLEIAEIL